NKKHQLSHPLPTKSTLGLSPQRTLAGDPAQSSLDSSPRSFRDSSFLHHLPLDHHKNFYWLSLRSAEIIANHLEKKKTCPKTSENLRTGLLAPTKIFSHHLPEIFLANRDKTSKFGHGIIATRHS